MQSSRSAFLGAGKNRFVTQFVVNALALCAKYTLLWSSVCILTSKSINKLVLKINSVLTLEYEIGLTRSRVPVPGYPGIQIIIKLTNIINKLHRNKEVNQNFSQF